MAAHTASFDFIVIEEAEDVRVCLTSVDDSEEVEYLCLVLELLVFAALGILLD